MELSSAVISDATFPLSGGPEALRESLHRLRSQAEQAIHGGYHVLCLSDKEACKLGIDPIPSLLALGAVHTYLCRQGLRERCSLVVQAGDIQEGHDIACLVAFGADAVHSYLMLRIIKDGLTSKDPDTKQEWSLSAHECLENLFAALEDSLKKIISKMGITTIEGYRGARLFEAVGFGPELMEFLGDCPSRIGGIGFAELVEDVRWRVEQAEKMTVLGRNRDYHAFNAKVRMALRKAATADEAYPQLMPGEGGVCVVTADRGPLNARIVEAARDAIDMGTNTDLMFRIKNSDRSVGATAAGMIAKLYGREGMPNHRRIKVRFEGEAGRSFGAWCVNSLDLELRGWAQDGVAKGISGGAVVVTLDYAASDYGGELQSVAGTTWPTGRRAGRCSSAAGPATGWASATPARRSWPRRRASTPAST